MTVLCNRYILYNKFVSMEANWQILRYRNRVLMRKIRLYLPMTGHILDLSTNMIVNTTVR